MTLAAPLPTGPREHFAALARWIAEERRNRDARVFGINGAQGTGKSTLARGLTTRLRQTFGLAAVTLSLDDFYLTRAEREALARDVHPLLRTRGVPGTHDVALGVNVLDRLRALPAGGSVAIPQFVKARDDRAPAGAEVRGPVDIVLFEGWCVGLPPQPDAALAEPVNELERMEDADAAWRHFANRQLATAYRDWFARIERLIFLQVPDFATLFAWRAQQETDNARQAPGAAAMTDAELRRFIRHYERLTRHALQVLPERADVTLELAPDHSVRRSCYRIGAAGGTISP